MSWASSAVTDSGQPGNRWNSRSATAAQRFQVVFGEPETRGPVLLDEGVDLPLDQVNQVHALVEQHLEPAALVGVQPGQGVEREDRCVARRKPGGRQPHRAVSQVAYEFALVPAQMADMVLDRGAFRRLVHPCLLNSQAMRSL